MVCSMVNKPWHGIDHDGITGRGVNHDAHRGSFMNELSMPCMGRFMAYARGLIHEWFVHAGFRGLFHNMVNHHAW